MRIFSLALAVSLTAAGAGHAAPLGKTDMPIKLAVNDWTGQKITTHLAGAMLRAAGYTVKYVETDYMTMELDLTEGDLSAAMEVWRANASDGMIYDLQMSTLTDMGDLGIEAREGLVYDAAAAAACPGLPDWKALRDCAAAFATDATAPNGRLLDYPKDWGDPGAQRIKALNLPFTAQESASEEALTTAIEGAATAGRPILATFWRPSRLFATQDLNFVDLPTPEAACFETPGWGTNPKETGDCGFMTTDVIKVAWPKLKHTWPAAYEILSKFQLTTEDQEAMLEAVEGKGQSVDQAVDAWMKAHEDSWKPVVDGAAG